jgi:hypothetical protein
MTACAIEGWVNDKDPAGLNVRAAPGLDAKVIFRIPRPDGADTESDGADFAIIGARAGWLLVRNVKFSDYGSGKGDRPVFKGPGWVFADKVRFEINDSHVYAAPSATARVLASLADAPNGVGPDSAVIDRVWRCSGDFADVTVHLQGKAATRGWVTRICANQVTTCV